MPPARTGNCVRQKRSATPSPRYVAASGLGRARGMNAVVGGIPITIASSGSSRRVPLNSIARTSASECAADGVPPKTAAAVSSRGTRSITWPRTAPGSAASTRRSFEREALENVLFVGVAAEDARKVERERDAEQGNAPAEQPFELDRQLPAVRAGRLEQRGRPGRADRLARRAAQERAGPARDDGLGCRDGDHEIRLDERARDPERHVADRAELDQILTLRVVDDHAPAEASPELRPEEEADLAR